MIKHQYDDDKKHVHVLSYGGGTQSTALLLMALKGEINGVIPDYIIFSDTGWEPKSIYDWIDKVNNYIKKTFKREIIFTNGGNIREDLLNAVKHGKRVASLPFYTLNDDGERGMLMRQCTMEYKIKPIKRKIKELLGYQKNERVKEIVHIWKGISTDEIQRVKPMKEKWLVAEHPLVDIVNMDRSACVAYVEREGLGTPPKSSCIGCPFHDDTVWLEMKKHDPKSWSDAVYIDKMIRNMPKLKSQCFLHKSCKPLDEVDFGEDQLEFDLFTNECEGFCGN